MRSKLNFTVGTALIVAPLLGGCTGKTPDNLNVAREPEPEEDRKHTVNEEPEPEPEEKTNPGPEPEVEDEESPPPPEPKRVNTVREPEPGDK